ncbi:hypothetical protein [Streptomyces griseosporeus]|uniref:hypothetical protein n=1 Tax=Streptomyces griseosporeus TaxID=1910 RepID=UPI0036F5FE62
MTPLEGAAIVAGVVASGWPFGALACRRDPGPLARRDAESRRARAAAQDERDRVRLAHRRTDAAHSPAEETAK